MPGVAFIRKTPYFGKDLGQTLCCPARSILLQSVMHLDHLEIEFRSENLNGFARKPKESINANTEIGSKHDRDLPRGICDSLPTIVVLASGSDDQN